MICSCYSDEDDEVANVKKTNEAEEAEWEADRGVFFKTTIISLMARYMEWAGVRGWGRWRGRVGS